MRAVKGARPLSGARKVVLCGLMAASLTVLKMAMSPLPNIEPVSLLVMVYAMVFGRQVIWIVLSAGLVGAYLKRRDTDDFNFLSLAVFGGLLFLTIFEGGKTRYLIQFLPQILLVASIGLAGFTKKENI